MKTNSHCGIKSQYKGKTVFQEFTKKAVNKIALKYGFKKRESGKISIGNLIIGFMMIISKKINTYEAWASEVSTLTGKALTRQAIEERMKPETATTLKMILEEKLRESLNQTDIKRVKGSVTKFKLIMLEDSTILNLPKELSEVFPGNVSGGEKKSQAKIHALHNFTENTFSFLHLCNYTDNDQSLASTALPYLNKDNLLIRDMGFLVLDALEKLNTKGVYFISRKNSQTNVYEIDTGLEINLVKELHNKQSFDRLVLVGKKKKLKLRLVILPIPPKQAAERRRKAKKDRDKRLNHSKDYYELLGYTIFITNIPASLCKTKEILELYGLRWRIEIIFKCWKSCFSLEKLIPSKCENPARIYGMIYLLLMYILLFQAVWHKVYQTKLKDHVESKLSLLKMARFFIQHFHILATIGSETKLMKQLKIRCCYEHRKDRTNTIEKYEKMAA